MDANIAVTQFTAAGITVWALQKLKMAKWYPLLKSDSDIWIKRIHSAVAAIGVHTSIGFVWNPGASAGWHVLTITIPPLTVIAVEAWHWLGQFVIQEGWFQVVYGKPVPISEQKS